MKNDEKQMKILARVRKMMALASNAGATEGERDNAMRAVHNTLAKYNLTLSQVDATDPNADEARKHLRKAFLGKPWAIMITGAIARMYFCHYHYQTMGGNAGPTQKAVHNFVGRHSNVVTAQEMAEFVVTSVNREAQKYQRGTGGTYADYRAFAQGAAGRVFQRCAAIETEAKSQGVKPDEAEDLEQLTQGPPGTALVIATLYKTELDANAHFVEHHIGKLGSGRRMTIAANTTARRAGAEFGSKVSLHTQVTKDKK